MALTKIQVAHDITSYDPRSHGAQCDECPLNGNKVVPPQLRPSRLVILGEAPGEQEEDKGRPFVGPSGYRLDKALRKCGVERSTVHVTNTVLCRPPGKSFSPESWKAAIECCHPRLERELGNKRVILAAGAKAMGATTGKSTVFSWMGSIYPARIGELNFAVASIHPAYALRAPAYLPVWQTFVARAVRLASGKLKPWDWGTLVHEEGGPGEATVAALSALQRASKLSIDIENRPSDGHIRCIGVGDTALAVSVLLPPEAPFHSEADRLLRQLLSGPATKVLQNGRHDRRELRASGYDVTGPYFDTLLAHAIVAPRLKHDLGFMAALEFPAERWKSEFKNANEDKGRKKKLARVFEVVGPDKLLPYNCKDVVAQARLEEVFQGRLATTPRGQELFETSTQLNEVALKMQDAGRSEERRVGKECRSRWSPYH